MAKPSGNLFIVAAASGTGKTSLVDELIKSLSGIQVSVSHTTRPRRANEKDGENYHFIDEAMFKQMATAGQFIEHAQVFGHYYGTAQSWVEAQLAAGIDIILEIDWQGAEQIRRLFPEVITVFILPPSRQCLLERLKARGQDDQTVIEKRMSQASNEISHCYAFDYIVINDEFELALKQLCSIVETQRLRQARQAAVYADLVKDLLA